MSFRGIGGIQQYDIPQPAKPECVKPTITYFPSISRIQLPVGRPPGSYPLHLRT